MVAAALLRHRLLTAVLAGLLLVVLPAETGYAFVRLFRVNGWSGRPLTQSYGDGFDFIDRTLGTSGRVTMISYPVVPADFWQSFPYWRDIEFWNKSVVRAAYAPDGSFESTGSTFPKLYLRFDARTGAASSSPTRFVAQAEKESRFRIDGNALLDNQRVLLVDAGRSWRADWLTYGLTDDGWTKPGVTARLRVFGRPGQRGPRLRYLTLQVWAPDDIARRPFRLASNAESVAGEATNAHTVFVRIRVCVPPSFAEVRIRTRESSPIYGDMRDRIAFYESRSGGVFLNQIALADELGPTCRPRR